LIVKFFSSERPLSHARAVTCAVTNQLAAPGLGSLMAGRWIAGTGQLVLCAASCVLLLVWVIRILIQYYNIPGGFVGGETPTSPINWKPCLISAILLAVSWLWSGVTSISLLREAVSGRSRSLEKFAAPPPLKFDEARIFLSLASVPDWKLKDAVISRTFQFKDFPAAMKFVEAVAQLAEEEWHHPDIDIRWNKVTLALTTHDSGGLTEKDFALAKKFDGLSLR
jgi:4a-hydroxytetrahydrobiopterin dehydratase